MKLKLIIPTFALIAVVVTGCWRTKPPSDWKFEISPELYSGSTPKPAGESVKSDDSMTSKTAVSIDPQTSQGYENVPEEMRSLYGDSPLALTQQGIVSETLAHNRDIKIQGYVLQSSETAIPINRAIYDLMLEASAYASKDQTVTASSVSGTTFSLSGAGERRRRDYEATATQLLPSGAVFQLGYFYTRLNQASLFSPINPEITQGMTATLSQPLLRGFGPTVTNADINIAKLNHKMSAADFETVLQSQLQRTLDAYWVLVLAVKSHDVGVIAYTAALDLLRINKAKVEAGVLPPTEELQAHARAETRREFVLRARQAVRASEDRLKQAMFFQDSAPNWDLEIQPDQELSWREVEIDPEALLTEALNTRPEIRKRIAALERSDFEIIKARDGLKPELNIVGTVTYEGVGVTQSDAADVIDDEESYHVQGGLEFSVPLQNRRARYNLQNEKINQERAMEEYEREKDNVTFELRQAVRDIKTSRERIDITRSRVESETANLAAEQKRYEVGVSTSFQVLEFQEFLANAQESHILAIVDYNRALIALERARGTILETFGVNVVSPELEPETESEFMPIGLN